MITANLVSFQQTLQGFQALKDMCESYIEINQQQKPALTIINLSKLQRPKQIFSLVKWAQ